MADTTRCVPTLEDLCAAAERVSPAYGRIVGETALGSGEGSRSAAISRLVQRTRPGFTERGDVLRTALPQLTAPERRALGVPRDGTWVLGPDHARGFIANAAARRAAAAALRSRGTLTPADADALRRPTTPVAWVLSADPRVLRYDRVFLMCKAAWDHKLAGRPRPGPDADMVYGWAYAHAEEPESLAEGHLTRNTRSAVLQLCALDPRSRAFRRNIREPGRVSWALHNQITKGVPFEKQLRCGLDGMGELDSFCDGVDKLIAGAVRLSAAGRIVLVAPRRYRVSRAVQAFAAGEGVRIIRVPLRLEWRALTHFYYGSGPMKFDLPRYLKKGILDKFVLEPVDERYLVCPA
jgi:hypothetical protein